MGLISFLIWICSGIILSFFIAYFEYRLNGELQIKLSDFIIAILVSIVTGPLLILFVFSYIFSKTHDKVIFCFKRNKNN